MCSKCKEKYKRERVIHDKRWVAKGLCPRCGKEPLPGKMYCAVCSEKQTKIILNKYNERIKSRKCPVCGSGLQEGEIFRCQKCTNIHTNNTREKWQRERRLVVAHYGGKCACCGESTYEFLEIDHINNDGAQHRKITGRHVTSWIIRNNYPTDLRLLCANCNRSIARYGVCPHKQEPVESNSPRTEFSRWCRKKAIAHYGGKCTCCGESNWAFLEFDHINNDGAEHRKIVKFNAEWIIQNNYPDYLQLLCANCNKAKGLYGKCPHQA
jgi:Fe-S cluster biogenesis protein NfuA